MASLKVYVDLVSQPSRAVMLLLKANKIPFITELINIAKGMHLTNEDFADVNPSKKVPAIRDGDLKLFEWFEFLKTVLGKHLSCTGTAIMRYICAKYKLPDHWYPIDIDKRAKIDEYLSWHHTNTRPAGIDIIWGKVFAPRLLGKPVDEKKIARGKKQMAACVEMYDSHFLKTTPFISSEQISIADLLAVTELSQLDLLEKDFVQLSSIVKNWQQRCVDTLGVDYVEVHTILNKLRKVIQQSANM